MPATFKLDWQADILQGNENITSQQALIRKRMDGLSSQFYPKYPSNSGLTTAQFSPANPLAVTAETANSPQNLADNVVWQFKIQAICSLGGPTDNIGGIMDTIHFNCINPTYPINKYNQNSILIDVTGTDIWGGTISLYKTAGDVLIIQNLNAVKVNNALSLASPATLTGATAYYWSVVYKVTMKVGGVDTEVRSSTCTHPFTTPATPTCAAVSGVLVTVVGT